MRDCQTLAHVQSRERQLLTYAFYAAAGQSQSMLARRLNIYFLIVFEKSHGRNVDACFQFCPDIRD